MYKKIAFIFLATTLLFADSKISTRDIKFEQPLAGKLISQKTLDKYVTVVYIWSASKRGLRSTNGNLVEINNQDRFRFGEVTYASASRDDLNLLTKAYEKLHKKGLRVVASHSKFRGSTVTDIEIVQVIPEDIPFPVYSRSTNSAYSSNVAAPYIYVFDVGGEVVFQGSEVRRGIDVAEKLLQNYQQKWLGDITTKFFRSELLSMLKNSNLGRVFKRLSKSAEKDDGEKQKEAKVLLDKLESMYETDIEELNASKIYDPVTYANEGRVLTKKWKGFHKADELKKSIEKLMKTKGFKRSIKAQRIYRKARKVYFSMDLPVNAKASFNNKEFVKDNRRNIKNLAVYCQHIKKNYSDTIFAVWANDMLKKIGSS